MCSAPCEGSGAAERNLSAQAGELMHVALPSTSTMCGTRLKPKMDVIFWVENRDRFCYARRPRIDAFWQRGATLTFAASCQARIRAATQIIAITTSREHDENVSIARPALIKKRGRRDIATALARGRCGPRRATRVANTIALHAAKRGQAPPHNRQRLQRRSNRSTRRRGQARPRCRPLTLATRM